MERAGRIATAACASLLGSLGARVVRAELPAEQARYERASPAERRLRTGGKERVQEPRPGTLFLWHDIYSTHNADDRFVVPLDLPPRLGWRDVTPGELPPEWRVFATSSVQGVAR